MRKPSFKRIEDLFHQAAELAPEQRPTFLDAQCAGDTALRGAVEELLKYDSGSSASDSFLASPVSRVAEFSLKPAVPPSIPGYELLEELGHGGMGVVYKARQTALNRLVALKMLLSGLAISAEHLARFRIEAEALARLQHPNVVQIFEVGEQEGRPYFSMEYVAGPSLAQLGTPQPARPTAQLVERIARAVYAVHRCGIIHRDLKPANILLQSVGAAEDAKARKGSVTVGLALGDSASSTVVDSTPKITDFGLAKLVKDQPTDRDLTQPGQALGTPSYMAPEQAWGKVQAVGPAADIYALGAILYELVTGKPPFEGETPTETILQLLSQEPVPPTHLRPALPRDLETICLKCLEKEPRKRYASAEALAEDLRRFQAGEPIKARPVSAAERVYRWCRRRPMVAALLAVTAASILALIATALVYNASLQQALAKIQQQAEREHEQLAEIRKQAEGEREQLVQRDVAMGMRHLENGDAFMALLWFTDALRLDQGDVSQEEKHRIRIATALQRCPRPVQLLVADEPVLSARLSPAGSWMLTTDRERLVRVWDILTGDAAGPSLQLDAAALGAAISPDGRLIATTTTDNLARIWDRRTGKPFLHPLPLEAPVRKVVFHSGSRVLLTRRDDFVVRLWNLAQGESIPFQPMPEGRPRYSTFSEDGKWVFILDDRHEGRVWDAATGKAFTDRLKLEQEVSHGALSLDGCRVALVAPDSEISIWNLRTGNPIGRPWKHPCAVLHVSFSPQGDRIITTGDDHTARIWQVTTGESLLATLRHDSVVTRARFSPDGRLAVTTGSDNKARVWETSTGDALTPPLEHNGSVADAFFSADSGYLLTIGKDDTVRLWELPLAAERVAGKVLAEEPGPPEDATNVGGRRLSWLNNDNAVVVLDAATGEQIGPPLRHQSRIQSAVLSPDGRRVLTASDDNTAQVWDAVTGMRLLPACQHKGTVRYAAFSPDGRRLITASEDRTARVWDAATGEPLTPPLKHPCPVLRAYFSSESYQAITVSADHVVRAWSFTPDNRPVTPLVLLSQVLAGSRIDEKYGVIPLDRSELRSAWQRLRSDKAIPMRSLGR
jgi:WD40 repeat protein/serine/threonine protein kinase